MAIVFDSYQRNDVKIIGLSIPNYADVVYIYIYIYIYIHICPNR